MTREEAMKYKEKLLREIFSWTELENSHTLFVGEYHADVHINFKGEWSWYAWKGAERIGNGKGHGSSRSSRAAAESCILEHQKTANGGK